MAINDADLLVLRQNSTGEIRKASIGALLAKVDPSADLQAVTDKGSTTTNGAQFGGNLVVGQPIFSGPMTNVGVEAHADKGAIHIRAQNNLGISALEIISAGSQLSHYKVLGSGDLKIGSNVNQTSTTGIELNPDGSASFGTNQIKLKTDGSIEAVSIDGGTYA